MIPMHKKISTLLSVGFTTLALFAGAPVWSQQAPGPVEDTARAFLEAEAAGLPGRVEVSVGAFDPGNQLPRCAALEAFLPSGTRAWGRISVGVRCVSPVVWTAYLPSQVAVMTDYLMTAQAIRPGQIIGPDDIALEHGDLAALPANTLTDPSSAIGHHARFAVAAGNPLRADMLRLPPAVQQGQTVKIVGSGAGFSVTNEGRALNRASEGDMVRVRLPNGQVVTGTARAGGIVEVRF